jgi:cyclic beta-1,2-glucan synthetase
MNLEDPASDALRFDPPCPAPSSVGPIRGEVLGVERLESLAASLADSHRILVGARRGYPLLERLRDNGRALHSDWRLLAEAARSGEAVSPAAEWLIDNFHLVEAQLREIQEHLPLGFYRQLPKLADGPLQDHPRVYALIWSLVAHTDSHFELEPLQRMVMAYQRRHPLTIGELWAIAISLRLVLIENLRRLANELAAQRRARQRADKLADVLLAPDTDPEKVRAQLHSLERAPLASTFAVHLIQRLRDCDPETTEAIGWLDGQLARRGTTAEEEVRQEHLHQVAILASVRNAITSLRAVAAVDWATFVEEVSLVDEALRGTPFPTYDFPTRDRYRHAIELLARRSQATEREIAARVALYCRTAPGPLAQEPGFWLIGPGLEQVEAEIGFRPPPIQRIRRWITATPAVFYLSSITLTLGLALAVPLVLSLQAGAPAWLVLALLLLGLLPASEIAVAVINRMVTLLFPPVPTPKLELEGGIPAELRTVVVVPALLTDEESLLELVRQLEVHYLGNDEPDLRFLLLTDWKDAPTARMPGDEELLAFARQQIARLCEEHGSPTGGGPRFWLLHRERRWNESEGCFMGWERKRGKLHELNRALRGRKDTTILWEDPRQADALAALKVKYVVTLDADTRLPRGMVRKLVGAMAHPRNRPVHDPHTGRVISGHGILQPRITPTLAPLGEGTLLQQIHASHAGLDPYAFVVSDVYQDLFGEGSYTGKGIYDVDAFEQAMMGQVPENTLLSHDLLEGLFARAGLACDLELFESFPEHYQVSSAREHRWVRGDWQLLPWLLQPQPIRLVGRWKMLDNLRRSLVPPAALALLVASWLAPPPLAAVWTTFVLAALALPSAVHSLVDLATLRHPQVVLQDLAAGMARVGLGLVTLLDQAWRMLDAVVRTLYRLTVSRRHLLEWVTAAQVHRRRRSDLAAFYRSMPYSVLVPLVVLVLVVLIQPSNTPLALIFGTIWAFGPAVALAVSLPPMLERRAELTAERRAELRHIARQTWRFFETWVGPEDHFLPPDNFQEDPEQLAHRTSPTNIGLYTLSSMAAHDMGWIGTSELVERLGATLDSVSKLEGYRGHLYNWYDTRTLAPLLPRYVSTVDSGNLAGHLMVLEQGLLELLAEEAASVDQRVVSGLQDAIEVVRRAATALPLEGGGAVRERQIEEILEEMGPMLLVPRTAEAGWWEQLSSLAEALVDVASALTAERGPAWTELAEAAQLARRSVLTHRRDKLEPVDLADLLALAERCEAMSARMDWHFLYNKRRRLFSIGFDCEQERLDGSWYDLLASEARMTSFVAIARAQVPVSHWFQLGRRLTRTDRGSALVSWSGSMFEYLMPELVMAPPARSLIDRTNRLVVDRQIQYGQARGVPWGISEAAYNERDLHKTYQYTNFGVSGLGLKRGLADDLVIAPYATGLAAMIDPGRAADNFERLRKEGAYGRYGFYESIDYTAARLPEGSRRVVVRAYMAHHQGMLLVSLCNALQGFPMRRRFHASPLVAATELLLHERMPKRPTIARAHTEEQAMHLHVRETVSPVLRTFRTPYSASPDTHRLSNGRYSVSFTTAGAGQSLWNGIAVTRWRRDDVLDNHGSWIYLRDCETGEVWSAGYQPVGALPERYEVSFYEHRVGLIRQDGELTTQLEVVVAPEDDGELRRVTLVNQGTTTRTLEVTSYAEIVLAPHAADVAHPAFSKLFVETQFDPALEALFASRRPRKTGEPRPWVAHLAVVEGRGEGLQFETDRARFLGRGRTNADAQALDGRPLSNTTGPVLDPVLSLRRQVRVEPGRTVRLVFVTLVGHDRVRLAAACERYHQLAAFENALSQAWTHAQIQLRHLGVDAEQANVYQHLGARIVHPVPGLRPKRQLLGRNRRGQASLWPFGISGDRPIVLGKITTEDREIVRQLAHAHGWLALKGLEFDLVLLDDRPTSYGSQPLEAAVRAGRFPAVPQGGNVHVLRFAQLSEADLDLLHAVARVVLDSRDGSLAEQILRRLRAEPPQPPVRPVPPVQPKREPRPPALDLVASNGIGGFERGGREYVIVLGARQWTPAPWSNVLANPSFGTLVTESGGGTTWSVNSRERQLTPWSNDPVSDPPGEVIYVRDEQTREIWTPTPLPIRENTPYVIRHGQGYTRFEHKSHEIELTLVTLVDPRDPVKRSQLTLRNLSQRPRKLSVTAYVEWVLGPSRETASAHVVTSQDPQTGALLARNGWTEVFAQRHAFFDLGGAQIAYTGDRKAFLGRNGSLGSPTWLAKEPFESGRVGAGLEPCGALTAVLELPPGGSATVEVSLGEGADEAEAIGLVRRCRERPFQQVLEEVKRHWDELLGVVKIETPDPLLDMMVNRWLLYQVLSCRFWGRLGFYQAGGAYGFRDQLQDVMALLLTRPELAREQILRAAAHQFIEGDVLHWWHPPQDRGVRTRISDDRLWLPYVTAQYSEVTGDDAVLDEIAPFLGGPSLGESGAEDLYDIFPVSDQQGTLYEHGARAIDASLGVGSHGLPLIGSGDWNDGMNRIGAEGRGESVWLAWFLVAVLARWVPIAQRRGDHARATRWAAHADAVKAAIEEHGWDGAWYRRAFTDVGVPIGSAGDVECRIDSIAQSWSVLSGSGRIDRAHLAMSSVDEHLVRRADGVVLLLTPPFDQTPLDPGYIRGYLPGIRENGGQYTHAALWAAMAFAELGDGNRAGELLTMLNPAHRTRDRAGMLRYKVEPYVVAADVYGAVPHVGRGGWTWYTGSASWMYRAVTESLLGVQVRRGELHLEPCIPAGWVQCEVQLRLGEVRLTVRIENPKRVSRGIVSLVMDGELVDPARPIPLPASGEHRIVATLGRMETSIG